MLSSKKLIQRNSSFLLIKISAIKSEFWSEFADFKLFLSSERRRWRIYRQLLFTWMTEHIMKPICSLEPDWIRFDCFYIRELQSQNFCFVGIINVFLTLSFWKSETFMTDLLDYYFANYLVYIRIISDFILSTITSGKEHKWNVFIYYFTNKIARINILDFQISISK